MPHLDILPTMLENDKRNTGSFVKTLDQKGYIPEGSDHISKNVPCNKDRDVQGRIL
jgi:hypothetical protein